MIFNMIWYTSQCPKQWKNAILTPILKPGKDPSDPLSYRPISLTSTLCKLMERMVNSRLLWYIETNDLLTRHQSGFRKGRSTKDHILNLESCINKAHANKSTLAIFLDIEKAYDILWRKGIIIKLQTMGIYGRITRWIDNFLSDRKIQVRINNILSAERTLENGVPQGSVISPLLFNIAVNDLPKCLDNVQVSQYADDIAVWKSNKNIPFIEKKIQQNLNNINSWCEKLGFKLSIPKTIAVLFTNKKNTKISINLKNLAIQTLPYAKFLGVTFDSKLTWKRHIDNILIKCKKRLNLLRCISGNSWGADCKILYQFYTALIKPIVEYGCEAFDSASNTMKQKLDSIQYQALTICTGAIHGSPLYRLQIECGDPPFALRRQSLRNLYGTKIKAHKNHPNQYITKLRQLAKALFCR